MKGKTRIFVVLLLVLVGCFVAASIFLALFGKKLIVDQIENNLKMKAELKGVSLGLPLSINLSGLKIGDLVTAERISLSPSILGFLAGRVVLNNLVLDNPVITLEQSAEGKLNLPVLEQKGKQPPILLAGLLINNGKVVFTDKKAAPQGYKTVLDKIEVRISKIAFPPTSLNAKFKFSAIIADAAEKPLGSISGQGWVDFGLKDMDGTLEIKDLEATHFSPYYGDMISTKKLVSAKLNYSADMKAKNNDMKIKHHLELFQMVYEKEQSEAEGKKSMDLFSGALDVFSDKNGKIVLNFPQNTKMDKFSFDPRDIRSAIFGSALQNISSQRPEDVSEKIGNTVEQFKAIGKEFEGMFKKKKEQ